MRKFDTLSEHIKRLDSRVAENETAIKRETWRLPGRTDANLKCQVNVVLLRSGKCLIPSTIEINNTEKHVVVEEADENRSRPIILDDPNTESEIPRELRKRPSTLRRKKENLEKMSKLIDKKERTSIDKPRWISVDTLETMSIDSRLLLNPL